MKKKTSLIKTVTPQQDIHEMNIFQREKFEESHTTFSGNGSMKLTTTGNAFVDDFASIGRFRQPREYDAVKETMDLLWSIDPLNCLKEMVYIRIISREAKDFLGNKIGKAIGQGLKSEFWHRMYWLAINHEEVFKKNLKTFIVAGSWDDIFELIRLDLSYEHEKTLNLLDIPFLLEFIGVGLGNEQQTNLIKKYLPQIKSESACKTLRSQCNNWISKQIANYLFQDIPYVADRYKAYRQLKSSGTAHKFQQLISQEKYFELDFNTLPGRVIGAMTKTRDYVTKNGRKVRSDNTTFLQRHGLDQAYESWLDKQPVAKFTGFVYELINKSIRSANRLQKKTIDKQFAGLIDFAKKDVNTKSNFICCVDSSGSMTAKANGTNVSSYEVALSMAMYFSYLLEGKFKNTFLEFAHETMIREWVGETPTEKFCKTTFSGYCSNTNVLSVAHTLCKLRYKGYKEEEFPTGAILISDGEFDRNYGPVIPNPRYPWMNDSKIGDFHSTFDDFIKILREGGFSTEFCDNFKLVLWDIPNGYYGRQKPCFEGLADRENFFYMSGFSPEAISFLLGKELKSPEEKVITPKTSEELFEEAMNQELLNMLTL